MAYLDQRAQQLLITILACRCLVDAQLLQMVSTNWFKKSMWQTGWKKTKLQAEIVPEYRQPGCSAAHCSF